MPFHKSIHYKELELRIDRLFAINLYDSAEYVNVSD